jgi:A/G-specific adenine glycosylase
LPGIGCYTANAIASFAFGQPVPVVDANIARVIARLFDERAKIDSAPGKRRIWQHAAELLPAPNSAEHNSALMDLGALVCTARKPKCHICPVREFCGAPDPERLPLKRARPRTVRLTENHALVVRRDKILLVQATNRWRGMWILPPLKDGRVKGSSSRPGAIYKSVFPFTHHRVTFSVFRRERQKEERRCQRWFSTSELNSIPIPSPHRRAISNLLNG